jgi:hypothetical protein
LLGEVSTTTAGSKSPNSRTPESGSRQDGAHEITANSVTHLLVLELKRSGVLQSNCSEYFYDRRR